MRYIVPKYSLIRRKKHVMVSLIEVILKFYLNQTPNSLWNEDGKLRVFKVKKDSRVALHHFLFS
jgi:hypothetical protein